MNRTPDVELVLHEWLADDGDIAPDRILDVVAERIAQQPRRPASRLHWRFPVNSNLRLAVAAAAIVIVAVVGWQLLPRSGGFGGQPTPIPSPSPTSSPLATGPVALPEGTLTAGTYRLRPVASSSLTIDVTVPEGGWLGDGALVGPHGDGNGPNGVVIAFFRAQTINSDPCHWDKDGSGPPPDGDIEAGLTVDDLVEALAGNSAYESSTPVDATIGGFPGKRLELQLAPDPAGCDTVEAGKNQYFVFGGVEGSFFAEGGANRWQITIVDVAGTRLIGVLLSYAETSADDLSAAQGIFDSVVITP